MRKMLDRFIRKSEFKKEIIINHETAETRVAVLDEGRLVDFFIERNHEENIVGCVFKGVIQNLEDGLQAAFVDIGQKKNAFIHYWDMVPEDAARLESEEGVTSDRRKRPKVSKEDIHKRFPVGSEIVVQVVKGAIGTKGPRVTASISIPGRYLVMMPGSGLKGVSRKIDDARERQRLKRVLARLPVPPGNGLIVRTVAAGARKTAFVRDMRALTMVWEEIERRRTEEKAPCRLYQEPGLSDRVVRDSLTEEVDRIVIDAREEYERIRGGLQRIARANRNRLVLYDGGKPVFEHFGVERQLENALRRKVWLSSGGYLVFDETEAMIAIDINTGRHKGGTTQEESIVQVNLEAADEIARQLRLRNVGGLVVIDFIDMKQRKHQNQVYRRLKDALKHDRARTNVLPISALGLVEMTRQRMDESVRAATYTECPYCKGRGMVKSPLSMSLAVQRKVSSVLHHLNGGAKLKVAVHPAVLQRMRAEDEQDLVALERKHASRVTFAGSAHHMEEFTIEQTDTHEVLFTTRNEQTEGG